MARELKQHPGWEFETKAIHSGFDQDHETGATALPIYETTAFAYDTAEDLANVFQGRKFTHIYSRLTNPTVSAYEQRINALEDGLGAVATASGMAAITTVMLAFTQPGDEIITSKSLFGGTIHLFNDIFAHYGVRIVWVNSHASAAYREAVSERSRLIFLETIGNPKLDVPDIEAVATVAREYNLPLIIDSTLTTPYILAAKNHGANVVIHSTSKYLTGNGSAIGGMLVDLGNYDWRDSRSPAIREMYKKAGEMAFLARVRRQILQNTGSCLSPFNAYINDFSQALEEVSPL